MSYDPHSPIGSKLTLLKSRLAHSGGLEKYALRTAHAFADRGVEVTILTTDLLSDQDAQKIVSRDNIKVVNLGTTSSISYLHLKQFDNMCRKWLATHGSQIIFGMDRNVYQTHYRAGNGVHAAYLEQRNIQESRLKQLSFKLNPLHRLILEIEKKAFEHPRLQLLFTNSQMVKDQVLHHYRTPEEKIAVVHNGVEWSEMQSHFDSWSGSKTDLCNQLGLDPTQFQFLFVGHGYRRKGLTYLLEALSSLKQGDFQLSIVGKDREEEFFKQMVQGSHLEQRVKFFGPRGDIMRFYQVADALVIPSLYDPFANVTVEALAMGLFIVSSPFNGGSEVLTAESGAIISDLLDRTALQKALLIAMQHPKTTLSATKIRESVRGMDFSSQMNRMVELTLRVGA